MDLSDSDLMNNRDWDPSYLIDLFKEDFFDFGNLQIDDDISDQDICSELDRVEKEIYAPIVEDISFDEDDRTIEPKVVERK